jgi:hypothetical protein
LKEALKGRTFANVDELRAAVEVFLSPLAPVTLFSVFQEWIKRCEAVVASGGEYYQHAVSV